MHCLCIGILRYSFFRFMQMQGKVQCSCSPAPQQPNLLLYVLLRFEHVLRRQDGIKFLLG